MPKDSRKLPRPKSKVSPVKNLLAEALKQHQLGNLSEAVALYNQSIHKSPCVEAYANLGAALRMQGHIEAAIIAYRQALKLEPQHVTTLSNLGGALRALGQLDAAITVLNQTVSINPDFATAYYNLGLVWGDKLQPEKAISCFDAAYRLEPERMDAQFDRAVCLLQKGDFRRGFEAYECRFAYEPCLLKPYTQAKWDGSPLNSRTLLLHAEQGFGDTLQFIRYVSKIPKGPSGRIILECDKSLKRLMEQVPGIDQVIIPGEALPDFDTHLPLLSLPLLFTTTLDSIPADCPYLSIPAKPVSPKIAPSQQLKVGIAWASGQTDVGVRNRRIPLAQLLPLLELPGVQFYSLQKGPQAEELDAFGFSGLIENMDSQIKDFADTAAILDELDLLISADTALVHLAGALNKPTWVLLPYGSEWRWMLNRTDSPWYPSMRLFRHALPTTDWQDVIADVREALLQWLLLRAPSESPTKVNRNRI